MADGKQRIAKLKARAATGAAGKRRTKAGGADYSRIHRLLKILTLVQSEKGWNPQRLALECQANVRTIYRDLKMLDAAGIPLSFDDDTGGYVVRPDFFMPPVDLTFEEALAIVALGSRIAGEDQIPFVKAAARAVAKVRGQLPARIRQELDLLDEHIHVKIPHTSTGEGYGDVYERVREAIRTRKALRCSYEAPNGDAAKAAEIFVFKPYELFFCQRAWYAVGYHGLRDGVRTLKLNRFSRIEPTDLGYQIPKDFSLEKHLGNAWRMIRGDKTYQVELAFDKSFGETIGDTQWHKCQELEHQEDGTLLFRCKVDGLDEILWWVLSMGPHCRVIHPPELRQRVCELAAGVLAQYQDRPGTGGNGQAKPA